MKTFEDTKVHECKSFFANLIEVNRRLHRHGVMFSSVDDFLAHLSKQILASHDSTKTNERLKRDSKDVL